MSADPPPCRPVFSKDDRRYDRGDDPPAIPCKHRRDAFLDIKPAQEILDVVDACLDLDHEQDPEVCLIGKDVDPAPVSVMIEADLALDDPTGAAQQVNQPVLQLRVTGIGEGTFAIHAKVENQVCSDGC